MLTIQEAEAILTANLPPRRVEQVPLPEAEGRILAKAVLAAEPSPRYTNSAMDGYAVRWEDIKDARQEAPVVLQIAGESQAGIPFDTELQPGQAARISTGAMICRGADAVVPIEEVKVSGTMLQVLVAKQPGQHLRYLGEEFEAGVQLLAAGVEIGPAQLAMLASQGICTLPVYQQPRAAIIVTGTELVAYDAEIAPWQIRESNGMMLQAALRQSGARVVQTGQVGDDPDATLAAVKSAMKETDLIIFSGGVSVGPHDLVKAAAADCGFETLFWRVLQKPGKPLFLARQGDCLFFGLPGNPVSAFMCYLYYIHPLVRHWTGGLFERRAISGIVAADIENNISRAQLYRVRLKEEAGAEYPHIYPVERQGSHMLTSLTEADGFIALEPGAIRRRGEKAAVITFFS